MSNSSKRGSSMMTLSLVIGALMGVVKMSPAAVELGHTQAASSEAAAVPAVPVSLPAAAAAAVKVVRHIATSAVNTTDCEKITADTAGTAMPFTSYHTNRWAVTGNDRNALRNDLLSFGTTFTGDYRMEIAADATPELKVEMPTALASGGPVGMFR